MTARHKANKRLVLDYLRRVEDFRGTSGALSRYFSADALWYGCAPFDAQVGPDAIWQRYWRPLFASFSSLRRRVDILLAGECESEDWVASTGYLFGRFERDWLGIPATGRQTFLRYGEFYRVDGGAIDKAFVIVDLVDVMRQSGINPLPASLGLAGFAPPPRTGDGLLLEPQSSAESEKTFALAYTMLFQGLNAYDKADKASMKQAQFWHDDMHWYGPAGIDTTRDLREFERHHQLPWLRAFPDRQVVWESPMFAEGHYAATAGWREVIATHTGPYLGHPATGKRIEFRVMDFWRREGDLLSENWVLIDLLDVFRQFGADILPLSRKENG